MRALVKRTEVWPEFAWLSSMRPDGGKFRAKAKYGYYWCENASSIDPDDYDLDSTTRTATDRTAGAEPEEDE